MNEMEINRNQINPIKKFFAIIVIATPPLLSILIYEIIHILLQTSIFNNNSDLFPYWIILHAIPGLIFAYISDRNYRKTVLLWLQTLGVLGGGLLYLFGNKLWVILAISVTINMVPVARAALLELFPKSSSLKIIAITYLAMFFPWINYKYFETIPIEKISIFIILMFLITIFLTHYLFKEHHFSNTKNQESRPAFIAKHMNQRLILTFIAFILAESMLYSIWYYTESSGKYLNWSDLTNYASMFGFASILLYNRLPHLSIITLFYTICFGIFIVSIITCTAGANRCEVSLLSALSNFCVISGMILPFITEAIIKMFGKRNKAMASAMLYCAIMFSSSVGTSIFTWIKPSPIWIMYIIAFLILIAVILQKKAEKEILAHVE